MLNNTSSYYKPKEIDFTVMGLNERHSKVLNWCMKYFDNCEFLQEGNFMESQSMMVEVHFDDLKNIKKTKKPEVHERA